MPASAVKASMASGLLRPVAIGITAKSAPPRSRCERVERRHLAAAGGAPGGPEIDEPDPSVDVGELVSAAARSVKARSGAGTGGS